MESNSKPTQKSIIKKLSTGIATILFICGIAFIILLFDMLTGGTGDSHTKQKYAKYELLRIDQALEEFKLDLNVYPDKLSNLYEYNQPRWMGPYIKEKELKDPWGEFYYYRHYPKRTGYQVFTLGKDKKSGGNKHDYDQLSDGSLKLIEPILINENSSLNLAVE